MKKKPLGKHWWLPKIVVEEVEDIKKELKVDDDRFALLKIVEHARVGREMERIWKLDFSHKPLKSSIWGKKKNNGGNWP